MCRIFRFGFAALSWVLWMTRNKFSIDHIFPNKLADCLCKLLNFLHKWKPKLGQEGDAVPDFSFEGYGSWIINRDRDPFFAWSVYTVMSSFYSRSYVVGPHAIFLFQTVIPVGCASIWTCPSATIVRAFRMLSYFMKSGSRLFSKNSRLRIFWHVKHEGQTMSALRK